MADFVLFFGLYFCITDVNECKSDPCEEKETNAVCVDQVGGYTCQCEEGRSIIKS